MTCDCERDFPKDAAVLDFNGDGVLSISELRAALWEHFTAGIVFDGPLREGVYAKHFQAPQPTPF